MPTILVVEDEWLVRQSIVDHLRDCGFTVLSAGNGEMALVFLAQECRVDLVFTDIKLSGPLSGWDVANAFRAKDAHLPVIYASGLAALPGRLVQGSLFFRKPYQFEEIEGACRSLCISGVKDTTDPTLRRSG